MPLKKSFKDGEDSERVSTVSFMPVDTFFCLQLCSLVVSFSLGCLSWSILSIFLFSIFFFGSRLFWFVNRRAKRAIVESQVR